MGGDRDAREGALKAIAVVLLSASAAAGADTILWDARAQDAYPAGVQRFPKLPPAEERGVLSKITPRFLTDTKECRDGRIVYQVNAVVRGAFTAKDAAETAYLVEGRRCESEVDLPFDSTHLLVFRDGAVVARAKGPNLLDHAEEEGEFHGTEIRAVTDVDGDGVDEILAVSTGFGQGVLEQMARLYGAKDGRIRKRQAFAGVYSDDCNSSLEERQVVAHVLRHDGRGRVTVEDWVAPCRDGGDPKPADFRRAEP